MRDEAEYWVQFICELFHGAICFVGVMAIAGLFDK